MIGAGQGRHFYPLCDQVDGGDGPVQISVARLQGNELNRVRLRLLSDGMPVKDLLEPDIHYFAATTDTGAQIGWGGLEVHGSQALMRAVMVNPVLRGIGAGSALVHALLSEARRLGVTDVWLLTSDAAAFFARQGFASAEVAAVPETMRQGEEFLWHQDSQAACMHQSLA